MTFHAPDQGPAYGCGRGPGAPPAPPACHAVPWVRMPLAGLPVLNAGERLQEISGLLVWWHGSSKWLKLLFAIRKFCKARRVIQVGGSASLRTAAGGRGPATVPAPSPMLWRGEGRDASEGG